MKTLVAMALLLAAMAATAQTERAWERAFHELATVEDGETEAWEDAYELLCELEEHPLDLNTATREELEALPLLTDAQVQDLMEYLYRHGPMKSLAELRMVRSLDYRQLRLLPYFVCVSEREERRFPSPTDISRYGRHEVAAAARVPFYERRGDQNGYLGYRLKHWTSYQFSYGDYVKAGLVGAQDAGEPFMANKNGLGYDFYSLYAQVRHLGRLETAVVGKYKLSAGMGLALNNSFGLGKLATLQTLGRGASTLRAHAAHSQTDYFQGAAATVRLSARLSATAFASYRPLDATLNAQGQAQTIVTGGYHRTPTEMSKKNNTHATAAGAHASWRHGRLHAGATAVYTHLDRQLQPDTSALYRRHYAQGQDFANLSADYGYTSRRLTLCGETAIDHHGHLATANTASLRLLDELSVVALQRFYSYRYHALYARSLSEGGRVQNESGLYLGADWRPSPALRLQAYTDYAYFPWARYQVSQSSHAWDHLLQADYTRSRWSLTARYRLHLKQRDDAERHALTNRRERRARLAAGYAWDHLSLSTQADGAAVADERGWALSQYASYQAGSWKLNASLTYFDTDSYDTRLYLYERAPRHTFSFPMLYGQGLRYALMARLDASRQLSLTAKLGITDYLDRPTIGTGYQQIAHSAQTDLDLQLRWKF